MQYKPIIIQNSKYKTQCSSVVLTAKNFVNSELDLCSGIFPLCSRVILHILKPVLLHSEDTEYFLKAANAEVCCSFLIFFFNFS